VTDAIGYLPEERGLYRKMQVRRLLRFLGELKGISRKTADERITHWMERLGLRTAEKDWGTAKIDDLSRGMQQKVQFIGTLLHDPQLIILDEPFSGLDPINAQALKDTVVELRRNGKTVIFSTHLMDNAERLCDAVCIIARGEVVLDGPLGEVKANHGGRHVALSLESANGGVSAILADRRLVRHVDDSNRYLEVELADGADPQELDAMVGRLLKKLDDLGIADNTIVMYSTDNGAEKFTWPDGGQSPFRGEKNTNWEGGYRVPCAMRWPGVIKPGTVNNDIFAHEDMLPTLCAAAGDPDVKEKLRKGMKVGEKTFKVHLDGYNITDALAGKSPSPRREFFYFNDDGSLVGLRYDQWKIVFAEQREHGMNVWQEPFVALRLPKLFNLRADPFETADHEGMDYERWRVEHLFAMVPAQEYVGKFLSTFKEFPPSQKPGSFSIDGAMEALKQSTGK
jgi:ABC-type uncharacterized transport system ATPase subunit